MSPLYYGKLQQDEASDVECCNCQQRRQSIVTIRMLVLTLVALDLGALFWLVIPPSTSTQTTHSTRVNKLDFPRNTPIKLYSSSGDFASANRTAQDKAWEAPELSWGSLVVAIDGKTAQDWDLAQSQTWPWDQTKKQYIFKAGHDLHCLHTIRHALNQYRDGVPEEQHAMPYEHTLHCLNTMRELIQCAADETLLYIGYQDGIPTADGKHTSAGYGQPYMCRDWLALRTFALQNSACYEPFSTGTVTEDESYEDQYKFCPDGSTPWLRTSQG